MAGLDDVTDPAYLEGLHDWPVETVVAKRDTANEVETGLSYFRRTVQGGREELRRRQGSARIEASEPQQPPILREDAGIPRVDCLKLLQAGDVGREFAAQLEAVIPSTLESFSEIADDDLRACADGLEELERSISTKRQAVINVLNQLQDEIIRRFNAEGGT